MYNYNNVYHEPVLVVLLYLIVCCCYCVNDQKIQIYNVALNLQLSQEPTSFSSYTLEKEGDDGPKGVLKL